MQYKTSKKILIDKRKLDVLIRLNCPKELLFDAIVNNKITKTGDDLIDDNLESLVDIKEFKNWGGNHNPTGKNQYTRNRGQDGGQLDQQDGGQLGGQDIGQDVDKDKDIDKDKDKDNIAKIDYYNNPIIEKVFEIYKSHCGNLVKLDRFYKRNVDLKKLVGSYLEQTENNLEYFTRVCEIANGIKRIGEVNVDLKTILRNHDGFYNGKYETEKTPRYAHEQPNDGLF